MNNKPHIERRSGQDRREKRILSFSVLFFSGKRRKFRRTEDSRRITAFDYYWPGLTIAILVVLSLSLLDAVLTLILLEKGAVELNPIMHYYIGLGPGIFVMVKYTLTALALLIMLLLHAVISARYRIGFLLFPICGLAFASVIAWQLYLLTWQSIM